MKNQDEIGAFFKEKFSQYEPHVPENVWNNIEQQLSHTPVANNGGHWMKSVGTKLVGAVIVVGTTAAALTYWSDSNTPSTSVKPDAPDLLLSNNSETESTEKSSTDLVLPVELPSEPASKETTVTENKPKVNSIDSQTNPTSSTTSTVVIAQEESLPEVSNTINALEQNQAVNTLTQEEVKEIEKLEPKIVVQPMAADELTFQMYGTEPLKQVKWQFGDGQESTEMSPFHTYNKPGEYIVTLLGITAEGRSVMDKSKIVVSGQAPAATMDDFEISAPNIFTPNGDGSNDKFVIQTKNIIKGSLFVYNIAGQLMYQSDDITAAWNGKGMDQNTLPEGTYFYIIKCLDTKQQMQVSKGYVTIFQ